MNWSKDTILLVDDEQNILDLASIYLGREGFEIETATNGIPKVEKVKTFNRSFEVDESPKGGLGKTSRLEKAISQEIARSHHGDLSVQSEDGEGTAFSVHLPLYIGYTS